MARLHARRAARDLQLSHTHFILRLSLGRTDIACQVALAAVSFLTFMHAIGKAPISKP